MNPVSALASVIAGAVHAVVTEYRRLDTPPPPLPDPRRAEINCTAASTQMAWQPARRAPASPFGFGKDGT